MATQAASEVWLRLRTARLPRLKSLPEGVERHTDPRLPAFAVAAAVALVFLCKVLLPRGLPNDILLLGIEVGGLNALPALGIVLVYRANRIINFAQGELGAFSASLAFMLMLTLGWPWLAAVPLSLLAATVAGALIEFSIIRRFFTSPRLIMTVATIGLAQILGATRLGLPGFFPDLPPNPGSFPSPFGRRAFSLGPSIYSFDDVIALAAVPALTILLAVYLRGTWAGLGTRAAAENVDRSRLLGIRVRRLSTIVWAAAGLLSGVTAVLRAPVAGFSLFTYSGTGLLVRALVPAAIGGFTSLPVTFGAAVVLGVVEQAFFWNFARGGPLITLLLVVLLAALLVRSRAYRTLEGPEASSWTHVGDVRRVPRAISSLGEYRAAVWGIGAAGLLLLLLMPRILEPGQVTLVGLVGVSVIAGLSLIVLTGWIGQVSLGQWALVGVGAFAAGNAVARWDLDFFATIAIGALVGGIVSLLLGIPAQRMPGMLFGVTTLAFALSAQTWLFEQSWVTVGSRPSRPVLFGRIDISSPVAYYYVLLAGTLLALWVARNFKRYRLADVFVAVRDNPRAAESFAVSVTRERRLSFFLSGVLAGYAGVLYAFHQGVVDANRFPAEQGIALLSMVVIGGLGSISGVVAGATFVRVAQYLLPGWIAFFTTGIGLLVVLLVFPGGIGEVLFRLRYRMAAWLGRRKGIITPPPRAEPEEIGEPLVDEQEAVPT